jgi:hypothetical protein
MLSDRNKTPIDLHLGSRPSYRRFTPKPKVVQHGKAVFTAGGTPTGEWCDGVHEDRNVFVHVR